MVRGIFPRIVVILASFLSTLVFSEVMLRVFWKPAHLDPQYRRDDFSWIRKNVSLNRFGYRDREFSLEKKQGAFRIYSLGDSYTYGWYIDDPNVPYPKVLEQVAQNRFGKDKIEVINASRPGFSFADSINRFENEGKLFSPDLVTVGINIQDLVSKEFPPGFAKNKFLRRLYLYQLTFGNIERARVAKSTDGEIRITYKDGSPQMEEADRLFAKLHDLAQLIGVAVAVIIFPEYNPAQPNADYQYPEFHKKINALASSHDMYVVDLLEAFDRYPNKRELVLNPIDPHPSALAHKKAGEYIAQRLPLDELVKKPPRNTTLVKEARVGIGERLLDFHDIVSINPSGWVFFDRKYELGTQRLFLPEGVSKKVSYLEDIFKTAMSFTHEGWPGAKIEYQIPPEGQTLTIPRTLYGFSVVGISKITGFWREDGSLNSQDLGLSQVEIFRDAQSINLKPNVQHELDLYRVTLDVEVRQIDVKDQTVVGAFKTKVLTGTLKSGERRLRLSISGEVGSLPKFFANGSSFGYAWLGDKLAIARLTEIDKMGVEIEFSTPAQEDAKVEIPVASQLPEGFREPTIKYL